MDAENNRCLCISVDSQAEYVAIDKILSVVGQVLMIFKKIHCCKHCRMVFVFDSDIEDHARMHGH